MMSGFGKAQNAMNSRAVPGGDPVVVKSGTVALGVRKALRSQKVMAMDVDGASVGMNMDILGENDGDEIEQATNFTSSKVYSLCFLLVQK